MLVDNIDLTIKAGDGGKGMVSFMKMGHKSGGPDGGNGGNGGNIYFQGSHNLSDLRQFRFRKEIIAENGVDGGRKNLFGKYAPHITVYLPLGTQVSDTVTGKVFEITNDTDLILAAKGGIGGRGNTEFKSATNQAPRYAEKGTPGESKILFLELKLIADIGLVGLPNSGKSSLLAALTSARPKIGNYPFTTLEPNIGVLGRYAIADIPGLIEGASKGRGLGIAFLRHIEKTKLLVHCLESFDTNIKKTYEIVRREFKEYQVSLLDKPEIILLTKTDLAGKKILEKNLGIFRKMGKKVLSFSIYDPGSIGLLKQTLEAI
jgi:GTP-binding protein